MQPLFSLDGLMPPNILTASTEAVGANGVHLSFVPSVDALSMFCQFVTDSQYRDSGSAVLYVLSAFTRRPRGHVVVERTLNGGKSWAYADCLGSSGLISGRSGTWTGPTKFFCMMDQLATASCGIRIRARATKEMEPIPVAIRYVGIRIRHTIRTESSYVIEEEPL